MPVAAIRKVQGKPKPTVEHVNFGDLSIYTTGGGIPEGDYAMEHEIMLYQATKQDGSIAGPLRLGVMLTAHSLTDQAAEPRTRFVSFGSRAHEAFMPDPDSGGKKMMVNPNGPGVQNLNTQSNWALYLKSLYDSGLPVGVFTDDVSVLDGVHVHLTNIPEPEERKGFGQSATAEIQGVPRQNQTIPCVTEILEDGKPWEGTGGIPEPIAEKPNGRVVANKIAARPAVVGGKPVVGKGKAGTKPAPTPEPEPAPAVSEEDVLAAAVGGITPIIEKNPDGVARLLLRTGTYKKVIESEGEDMAQAVIDTFFGSDDSLNVLLGEVGYQVSGQKVVPV